jgi:hypothetical protein
VSYKGLGQTSYKSANVSLIRSCVHLGHLEECLRNAHQGRSDLCKGTDLYNVVIKGLL